ncbi:MAG: hypothetical protein WCY19_04945 [Candidatus Gastranaerophilaceae bacterium]
MGKILNTAKAAVVKVDDILDSLKDDIQTDLPKIKKLCKKAVAKVSIALGSTTKDDEAISALLKAAIIAGVSSMTSGSVTLTSAQLDPMFDTAFAEINKRELAFGNKLNAELAAEETK